MTVGQLLDTLQKLKTKNDAVKFLIELSQNDTHAWTNIKYVTGYLSNEERTRILSLFK